MSGIISEMLDARQRATLNAINQIFNPGPVLNSANDGDEGNPIRNPQGAQKKRLLVLQGRIILGLNQLRIKIFRHCNETLNNSSETTFPARRVPS